MKKSVGSFAVSILGVIFIVMLLNISGIDSVRGPDPIKLEDGPYDITKEEQIPFISNISLDLQRCKGYSNFSSIEEVAAAGYNTNCFLSNKTDINNSEFSKLKQLEKIKGMPISNDYLDSFSSCLYFSTIWRFDFSTLNLGRGVIIAVKCEGKYYVLIHANTNPGISYIYRINDSEYLVEILNKDFNMYQEEHQTTANTDYPQTNKNNLSKVYLKQSIYLIILFILTLTLIVIVEILSTKIYFRKKEKPKGIIKILILINLITLPVFFLLGYFALKNSYYIFLLGEVIVILLEGALIYWFTKKKIGIKDSMILSAINNVCSFVLVGVILLVVDYIFKSTIDYI